MSRSWELGRAKLVEKGVEGEGDAGRWKSRYEGLETREHRISRWVMWLEHGPKAEREGEGLLGEVAGRLHDLVGRLHDKDIWMSAFPRTHWKCGKWNRGAERRPEALRRPLL